MSWLWRLHALGDRRHAERMDHRDDRLHQSGIATVLGHPRNEAAVDLQRVERQVGEMAERGMLHAEIVKREADAI